MTKTHTPGPWTTRRPFAWKSEINSPTRYIGTAGKADGSIDEMEANARLMSAAPDLLSALTKVIHYWDVMPESDFAEGGSDELIMAIKEARAAIQKAEGKE